MKREQEWSNEEIQEQLQKLLGFTNFRPGQAEALSAVMNGRSALVVMPTGAGKSLCYQLPALLLPGVTLVVSPLISLMKDQVDAFISKELGHATFINSSLSPEEQRYRLTALTQGKYRLVYVAPERFRSEPFLKILREIPISLFAVDEAHCISQWGHDFRPDYLQLNQVIQYLGSPQVIALTATATYAVQKDIEEKLGFNLGTNQLAHRKIVTGFDRPNLYFSVKSLLNVRSKEEELSRLLKKLSPPGLIYAATRKDTERSAEIASAVLGYPVPFYHAGLSATQRTKIQQEFMNGRLPVLAATNAFGMGIDKADIRFVIHYSAPASMEAYYQEIGRAGRDSLPAQCILLTAPDDQRLQQFLLENDAPDEKQLLQIFQHLKAHYKGNYAETTFSSLCAETNLRDNLVRVGLNELAQAGLFKLLDRDMRTITVQLTSEELTRETLRQIMRKIGARRRLKSIQLEKMTHYAEINDCRRRLMLAHFGDTFNPLVGSATSSVPCCDNCTAKQKIISRQQGISPQTSGTGPYDNESFAEVILSELDFVILLTIRHWSDKLGRTTLIKILCGSHAAGMERYSEEEFYGLLAHKRTRELENRFELLLQEGLVKIKGGLYPTIVLTPSGNATIRGMRNQLSALVEATYAKTPANNLKEEFTQETRLRGPVITGETHRQTLDLWRDGLSIAEIAEVRQLAIATISTHFMHLLEKGEVQLEELVSSAIVEQISQAIDQVGDSKLTPLKQILPAEITWEELKFVVTAHRMRVGEVNLASNML